MGSFWKISTACSSAGGLSAGLDTHPRPHLPGGHTTNQTPVLERAGMCVIAKVSLSKLNKGARDCASCASPHTGAVSSLPMQP
eukprot:scaffold125119_cov18-Tisochrysis_lutea.AAC.2